VPDFGEGFVGDVPRFLGVKLNEHPRAPKL
jgi:hypothetical protein